MAVFAYQARDGRDRADSGTIVADTPSLARLLLRQRGLTICALAPAKLGRTARIPLRRSGRAAAVNEFCRHLALLIKAGIPLAQALDVLGQQQRGSAQVVLRQIHAGVQSGRSLAEALAEHPGWFDEVFCSVIRVGQASGTLETALEELAEFQSRRRMLQGRLASAMIYPAILIFIGTGVVIFLMSHVVPQLIGVLSAAGRELPRPTRWLKAISDTLVANGWLIVGAILLLALATVMAWRSSYGRRRIERAIIAIPALGDLVRKANIARIAMLLSMLLRTNVRFLEAVRMVRQGLSHLLYADELARIETAVEAGGSIAEPLKGSRLFPPLVVHVLAVGQDAGELPHMLEQLKEGYEAEVTVAATRFHTVLEPALIVALAAIIGFVIFATILPILETTRMVQ